jgi:CRP/FNR family transcriptional regulator
MQTVVQKRTDPRTDFDSEFDGARDLPAEKHKRGEILFWEGDKPGFVFHIREGFVKLIKHGSTGKDTIVGVFGPGEALGELQVLDNRAYNATAVVMTPAVVVRQPIESAIRRLLANPDHLRRLARNLSARLRDAQETMQGMATERVEKRIATLLVKFAERQECRDVCTLTVPLTRQEIADMVGATIETTIRTFSRFIRDGAIRRGGRKVAITNLAYLREAARRAA